MTVRRYPLSGASQPIRSGACLYGGFSIRETVGAAAVVRIYDGLSAAGTLLDTISFAPLESARENYVTCGSKGDVAEVGIYVSIVSGTVEGSIRVST